MSTIDYHPSITEKLNFFLKTEKIPNIIFHGPSGSGKRTIVNTFVSDIYHNNKELMKAYVMNVNCAHGKGIKFVREDLKFFAKTHINIKGSGHFKTVILSNADNLTTDAQSALRRCIELFCHTTRFFIIVEDKYKLLKPILSRLCEIFVSEPNKDGTRVNLHKLSIQKTFGPQLDKKKANWLKNTLNGLHASVASGSKIDYCTLLDLSDKLYEKGYSGLDLMEYIQAIPLGALPPCPRTQEQTAKIDMSQTDDTDPPKQSPGDAVDSPAGIEPPKQSPSPAGIEPPKQSHGGGGAEPPKQSHGGGGQVQQMAEPPKYQLLLTFHKVKKEFRNEKLFMTFILNFYFLRSDLDLENISFM
uniref:AAA+ ATPase domain-containing protein n=1 Tax=viral metagenome TaxID=1070528 RepID=A0A6C0HHT2_9ZZZZ